MSSLDRTVALRRNIVRAALRVVLCVLWIVLGILLFVFNRGYTLLVDNRGAGDGSYSVPDLIRVSIDGGKGVEFFRNDRDRFPVRGTEHRIRIDFSDGRQPVETEFRLGLKDDMYLLSIPQMIAGTEPFVEPFYVQPEVRTTDESGEDDFAFLNQ
ncbi:MAG: hypothetical protein LBR47_04915 [Spirochaetaceae bacterium]|jgi:hypothetical protein|nr:hypothetical protein [Spirochaetaceae bacterium]